MQCCMSFCTHWARPVRVRHTLGSCCMTCSYIGPILCGSVCSTHTMIHWFPDVSHEDWTHIGSLLYVMCLHWVHTVCLTHTLGPCCKSYTLTGPLLCVWIIHWTNPKDIMIRLNLEPCAVLLFPGIPRVSLLYAQTGTNASQFQVPGESLESAEVNIPLMKLLNWIDIRNGHNDHWWSQ